MFTRIHAFKFQNEFAKESVKQKLETVALDFFEQGLLIQCFVDIDASNLYMINTWESAKASEKVFEKFKENVFTQAREMGVKISILAGNANVRFSDDNLLDRFTKVEKE